MRGTCAHCALPLGRRAVVAAIDGVSARFCCSGCVLAQQVTRARGDAGAAAALLVRLGLGVFFAMNVMMLSLPTYAPFLYGAAADGPLFVALRVLSLVLAAPVLVLLGGPILRSAWGALGAGTANADALIVLGTVAAYGLSVANVVAGRAGVYCETAAMLLVLVTLGRWLEASARAEAGAAIEATLAPGPARATRLRGGGREPVVPEALVPGDVVEVGPGDAFPTDGVVIAGTGEVDEALLTGESAPVEKGPARTVASGSCSIDGLFRVRVSARAADSAAARVAALATAARGERSPAERAADRVAAALAPAVIVVALAAGGWWTAHGGLDRGVLVALSVLVVACPCALGIATPVAVRTGLAAAVRRGVVVRNASVLERAAAVECVLFDKTGTLTAAEPQLTAVEPAVGAGRSPADLLAVAAALEAGSRHPLARAIATAARGLPARTATDVRAVPGRGVRGCVEGEALAIGSLRFAAEEVGRPLVLPGGDVIAAVVGRQGLLGTLHFVEVTRASAAPALAALRALGVRIGLVSGAARADAVVPALVPAGDAALGRLPGDKLAHVRARRGESVVAMVGDGINDAPALAAADVGIAVARAADLARVTADVLIVGDDLRRIPWLIEHARRIRRIARQNLAWAFGYNALAVAIAAAGGLTPLVASLAMLGSSLGVVANARRARGAAVDPSGIRLAYDDESATRREATARDPSPGLTLAADRR